MLTALCISNFKAFAEPQTLQSRSAQILLRERKDSCAH
jgi:hypothetical protein